MIRELIDSGRQVLGLTRNDAGAGRLQLPAADDGCFMPSEILTAAGIILTENWH